MRNADITVAPHQSGRLGYHRTENARTGLSSRSGRGTAFGWLPPILKAAHHWLELVRQRRALGQLDERLLKDIGLTQFDVAEEVEKPFWQP